MAGQLVLIRSSMADFFYLCLADHAARCGDHAAAGVHPETDARNDDVWRAVKPTAGADPGYGTRAGC